MTNYLNYLLEANISLLLFYGCYIMFVRSSSDLAAKRLYLVLSLLAAMLFPLIHFNLASELSVIPTVDLLLTEIHVGAASAPMQVTPPGYPTFPDLTSLFVAATLLLIFAFVIQLARMMSLLRNYVIQRSNGYWVIETEDQLPSFSFFNLIVIGRIGDLSAEEKAIVLSHEQAHAKLIHSIDLVIAAVSRAIFWMNPVTWLQARELVRIHEYQADAACLRMCTIDAYQEVLLRSALRETGFPLTHHLAAKSSIMKRLIIMKQVQKKFDAWRLSAVLAVALATFCVIGCQDQWKEQVQSDMQLPDQVSARLTELQTAYPSSEFVVLLLNQDGMITLNTLTSRKDKSVRVEYITLPNEEGVRDTYAIVERNNALPGTDDTIYSQVDETATPALGFQSFYEQIAQTLQYPANARKKGIEGKVLIGFVVNQDGSLTNFEIIKGLADDCDAEAMRAVMLSQSWHPARLHGAVVNQRVVLPINFKLN